MRALTHCVAALLCVAGLLCLAVLSCQKERRRQEQALDVGIRVKDDRGQILVLKKPARRIASLSPSNTEILFALGCGHKVVLRDKLSSHPAAARRLPATNPFMLSPDHIAGYSPDLVLLTHSDHSRSQALQHIGLATATFDPRSLDQMYGNIEAIGDLCGARESARQLVTRLRRRVSAATGKVRDLPRPSIYIETDGTDPLKPWTAGPGSFVDQLVQLAGGRNIASDLSRPFAQINAEEVLARQPDVILLMNVAQAKIDLGRRQGWSALRAVRQGKVIEHIHADLLSRPGPRLVDGLEALARALHAEAFAP